MISAAVTSTVNLPKVGERVRRQWRGHNNPIQSIASRTARRMKALFRKSPKKRPAPVGQPPHTRGGPRSIKNAVAYVMVNNGAGALVGMDADKIGTIAAYHEYGGRQPIRGKRRQYAVGKVGPLDYRHGYTTPLGKLRQAIPGRDNIAFGRLKTAAQVTRAEKLDRLLWPDVETKVRYHIYKRRPFRQRTIDTLSQSVRETAAKWKITIA